MKIDMVGRTGTESQANFEFAFFFDGTQIREEMDLIIARIIR
jgi:hypothetical protein